MRRSPIPWTDFSGGPANFEIGCTPVSDGCQNCYAEAWAKRNGRDFSQVTLYPEKLERLRTEDFASFYQGVPANNVRGWGARSLVFVCDLGDLFHEAVPNSFIVKALDVMRRRPDVDWQVLTKRPKRALDFYGDFAQVTNVWLGVTAENQKRADERIPILLEIPAAVRFVSIEPMLEPIVLLPEWLPVTGVGEASGRTYTLGGLDWVICGAESGPRRRPFATDWAARLYLQCKVAGIPFFGKQNSGPRPGAPLRIGGEIVHQFPGRP